MSLTTAEATIKVFKKVFARFRLPYQILSGNGPQYTSAEFNEFLKKFGITHTFSAVKHPATNGAAKNFVKTFKRILKILLQTGETVYDAIERILFDYRSIKHCTTSGSPAKLMLGRELRTRFVLLRPDGRREVEVNQNRQVRNTGGKRVVKFRVNEEVWVKDFSKNALKWVKAKIIKKLGPVTYEIQLDVGQTVKLHVDQLVKEIRPTARDPEDEELQSRDTDDNIL